MTDPAKERPSSFWKDTGWLTAVGALVASLAAVAGLVINYHSGSGPDPTPTTLVDASTSTTVASNDALLTMTRVSLDQAAGTITVAGEVSPEAGEQAERVYAFARQTSGNAGWQSHVVKIRPDRTWQTEIQVPKELLATDCCSVSVGILATATMATPDDERCLSDQGPKCHLVRSTVSTVVHAG